MKRNTEAMGLVIRLPLALGFGEVRHKVVKQGVYNTKGAPA